MTRISKNQAMLNTMICNVLVARNDYTKGKISIETLGVVYKLCVSFVSFHLSNAALSEFLDYHDVKTVKEILGSV